MVGGGYRSEEEHRYAVWGERAGLQVLMRTEEIQRRAFLNSHGGRGGDEDVQRERGERGL